MTTSNDERGGWTPGPWRVWRDQDPKERFQIIGMESDFICEIDELNTQRVANARLIAAAPDLLEACKAGERGLAALLSAAVMAPAKVRENPLFAAGESLADEGLAAIRGALAKAHGGSPC